MARVLICARYREDVGLVPRVLKESGCEADITLRADRYQANSFDPSRHVGLIVLGDDAASADNKKVYGTEMSWVRAAIQNDRAILGICHGAQLLAHIGGGQLKRWRGETDGGLTALRLTEHGETDPVVSHVKGTRVAQSHAHAFEVPNGAVDLAESPNQRRPHCDAFRIGRKVYGLQFHPEPDAKILLDQEEYGWRLNVPYDVAAAAEQAGRAVLRAWLEIARGG